MTALDTHVPLSLESGTETSANNSSMVVIHIFSLPQILPLCHHQQHNLPSYWRTVGPISTLSLACNRLFHRVQWLIPTNQPASPQSVLTICGKVFVLHVTCTHQPVLAFNSYNVTCGWSVSQAFMFYHLTYNWQSSFWLRHTCSTLYYYNSWNTMLGSIEKSVGVLHIYQLLPLFRQTLYICFQNQELPFCIRVICFLSMVNQH